MKKNYSLALFAMALVFFGTLQAFAVDYTISFTGSGKSSTVGSVEVQNLTKGTSVTVPGGEVLVLTLTNTALNPLTAVNDGLRISSSVAGSSSVSFYAKQAGNTRITVYSMDGRKVAGYTQNLQKGTNTFEVSLRTGAYVISVQGAGYALSGKMISMSGSNSRPEISFRGFQEKNTASPLKSAEASESMAYTPGDIMLYKGISGNYATIVTDVPTDSKTVNFNFIECKDASGNYYATVKIGNQIWMAENLKTTKFRTGADIQNITAETDWANTATSSTPAWCYRDNADSNNVIIGKLYNWWAANDARNIAPEGWHMPTRGEYDTLGKSLGGLDIAAAKLKDPSARYWVAMSEIPATNESGFSARGTGKRSPSGVFNDPNYIYFWTSTDTNATNGISAFIMGDVDALNISGINHTYYPGKKGGLALRCIMDDNTVKSVSFHASWQTDIEEWDFTYDVTGRVAQMVNLWAGAVDKTLLYDYSVPDKLTLTKDDNSVYASYDLNESGYITKEDLGGGDYLGYEYDNAGFGITFNEFYSTNVKKREVFITDGNVDKIVKYNDAGDTTQIKVFTYTTESNTEGIFQANIVDSDWKPYGNLYGRPNTKLIDSYTYWKPTDNPIVKTTATFAYTRDAKNRIIKIVKTAGGDTEQWDYTY